jgi:UDP-4-amino-4-deoxy-L-arabinose formyltransferase/UDP-glucuronic acid dehydrogenase (UDP-4-keto-hexauronic acid decarboxylating)
VKIAIIGRTEVLYETLLYLNDEGYEIVGILTAKEAPEYLIKASDFEEFAKLNFIPFAYGGKIDNYRDFLKTLNADIAISINYPGIISQGIIDPFPLGILNVHGGDLPKYRGNACQAWAIINGENRIGLCVHKMIGGELDSGDIISRDYFEIDLDTKITEVLEWIRQSTPTMIKEALIRLSSDPSYVLEIQSSDITKTLRCYPRKPEDGIISWNKDSISIIRLINACNKPYAGAFCHFKGDKLIIWDARLSENDEPFSAIPGQITKIAPNHVEVACGKGKIMVSNIEYLGKLQNPTNLIKSIRERLT